MARRIKRVDNLLYRLDKGRPQAKDGPWLAKREDQDGAKVISLLHYDQEIARLAITADGEPYLWFTHWYKEYLSHVLSWSDAGGVRTMLIHYGYLDHFPFSLQGKQKFKVVV